MAPLILHIGNKNYSSWSMRPWLILRKAELPFEESLISLYQPGLKKILFELSPAGTVPVLEVNGEMIPDSLAISHWAAKAVPNLWPKDPEARRLCEQVVEKMHKSFNDLRKQAPMNLRRRTSSKMPEACLADAAKMVQLWEDCLSRHNGPFLFDDWSIADAFYTPAATRFESYDLPRSDKADTYISELLSDIDYMDWEADSMMEPMEIPTIDQINR